jgi:acyl phosphate:glycerol-3-phosphate acyltransferase
MMPMSAAIGYLIGSLPIGYLAARRWAGVDLRRVGSGNVGATNVLRVSGPSLGVLVMAVDVAKGIAAVALAGRVAQSEADSVTAGVAAVAGHMFPIWLGGRGGKGVATACGAFAVLAPMATACAAAAFAFTTWATRLVSAGSVVATATLPLAAAALGASSAVVTGGVVAAVLIVWRHAGNLQRVWRGTEHRLGHSRPGRPRA